MTWILLIGGGLAVLLLIIGVIESVNSERALVEKRLGSYLGDEKTSAKETC
jgi:tight adherence protein B